MRPFFHPSAGEISLQGLLHALADPVRLDLFRTLCREDTAPVSCIKCAPAPMPKSSLSRHFQVLREAGLVRSERRGAEVVNMARTAEIDARFPGLLAAILSAPELSSNRKIEP
jgi:DNA-binding transcriptional ArsR family regulator